MEETKENIVVGSKWTSRTKQDEHGTMVRNKVRFVAKGYSQVEGKLTMMRHSHQDLKLFSLSLHMHTI
jgi:hypothetical protein